MRGMLASTCLLVGLAGGAVSANAAECGDVSIVIHNVQSAEVLAYVDKFILTEGYGCNVETVPGDTVPTTTSMVEKGDPDVSPETWVDLLPEVVPRGIKEGKIVFAAPALPDGGVQGWWIPKYVADAHPDIKTVDDALKHPELFPDPEDSSKGVIFNGAAGWGATVVTAQLYKAYRAEEKGFRLLDPGSAAGLDGAIAKAYERKEGFITYYWAPTSLLGKYEMVMLGASVPHDAAEWKRCITNLACPDPKVNAWPVDKVYTVVTKEFADRTSPEVMEYLNKRGWSNETVGKLMAWETENQATGEEGAKHFLEESKGIWTKWVPAEVAEKVEAAL
ncbi:glycine betaine ABC transporter substrate-binding protein [Sinorhizobium americanum]|uniref:Glycine betaine/proline transport system substrate-binding protein n=1 Tax=Sinorhizobium americanum TaxID=194963 RepID=A0A4V2RGH5_9HYPH|nr:glycine betaine ABC transporter substrate-binding protein [Sinorhizobium americanum]TCN36520.1 glycine betaine/proline transport system substrate-binding protein [Sinorhizobium americanum]